MIDFFSFMIDTEFSHIKDGKWIRLKINFNVINSFYNIGVVGKIVDVLDGESFVFRELQ